MVLRDKKYFTMQGMPDTSPSRPVLAVRKRVLKKSEKKSRNKSYENRKILQKLFRKEIHLYFLRRSLHHIYFSIHPLIQQNVLPNAIKPGDFFKSTP